MDNQLLKANQKYTKCGLKSMNNLAICLHKMRQMP